MAVNHLIIGLGGTGGSVIRAFRKIVYQECGDDNPEQVNIRYLYVDSSESDLNTGTQAWTILGHPVGLPSYSTLPIFGLNLKKVFEDKNSLDAIKGWIGNRSDWADILNSVEAARIVASQKRRLGRFLFAPHVSDFRSKVDAFVKDMEIRKPQQAGTTFHVCCGLAGGTGSGIVVDVVSQIRAIKSKGDYRIIIYAQLPEETPGPRSTGNYHANGYAALMELNALKINSWQPHDLNSTDGRRMEVQDPFDCCYLICDKNEAKKRVPVDELSSIVASFLFQKIVSARSITWGQGGDKIDYVERFENVDLGKTPEMSIGSKPEPRRTRSFISFGVRQIAYPEVEIREYLTYKFAQQACRQLLFNNWDRGNGSYKDQELKFDCREYVAKPDLHQRWYIDDEHLTLSLGILPSEFNNKTWRPIREFWKDLVPKQQTYVLDQFKNSVRAMMPELIRLCGTAYEEQYRGHGVRAFYRIKLGDNNNRGDIKDQTVHIREIIESELFEEWSKGRRSIHDIERIISALINVLQEKLHSIDANIAKLSSKDSKEVSQNEGAYKRNNIAWTKLGPLSIAFGKHKSLLGAQVEVLIEKYTNLTELEGYRYAQKLIEGLVHELSTIVGNVSACKASIFEATKMFSAEMAVRLTDEGEGDAIGRVVREYDPKAIKDLAIQLCSDKDYLDPQITAVRNGLVESLGDKLTFANFQRALTGDLLLNKISESCGRTAREVSLTEKASRVLGISLMELLSRKLRNGSERASYAKELMSKAMTYIEIDLQQKRTGEGPGICGTTNLVIAPIDSAPAVAKFREEFCNALQGERIEGEALEIVTNESRPHEVSIITLKSVFPARFVTIVATLREAYLERIKAGGRRAFLELHSEGESLQLAPGQELFDLFLETYRPVEVLPWVMIAQALGIIASVKDVAGRDQLILKSVDSKGLEAATLLGSNLEAVLENPKAKEFEDLKFSVRSLLNSEFRHIEKRKTIEDSIVASVRSLGEKSGINSPLYKQEREAIPVIGKILEIEV